MSLPPERLFSPLYSAIRVLVYIHTLAAYNLLTLRIKRQQNERATFFHEREGQAGASDHITHLADLMQDH